MLQISAWGPAPALFSTSPGTWHSLGRQIPQVGGRDLAWAPVAVWGCGRVRGLPYN